MIEEWPELVKAVDPLRTLLRQAVHRDCQLQDLARACGDQPSIAPPPEELIGQLRQSVARALRIPEQRVEDHHPASPWRWRIVEAIQQQAQGPDCHIVSWLRDGAPVGIAQAVVPGGCP